MKAILIDAFQQEVTEVSIGHEQELQSICDAIGASAITIGTSLPNRDCVYVDDEGLFNGAIAFFDIGAQPFAGNGLVVGTDGDVSVEPKSTVEEIRAKVVFFDRKEAVRRASAG